MVQSPVARRSEAKRAQILRGAAAVFRERGFFGAGMREIAAGSGMTPGALYYYFKSKEDLLYACQMLSLKRLLGSAGEISATNTPADTKLRRLARAHLGHILGDLGGGLAHVEFPALPPDRLAGVVSKRDAYEKLVRGMIREGVESGLFRKMDIKLAALSLLGALNWTVIWWRPGGRRGIDSVAGQMAETFLGGWRA